MADGRKNEIRVERNLRTITKKGVCVDGRYYYSRGMEMYIGCIGEIEISPTNDGKLFFRVEELQFELIPNERTCDLVGKHFPVNQ